MESGDSTTDVEFSQFRAINYRIENLRFLACIQMVMSRQNHLRCTTAIVPIDRTYLEISIARSTSRVQFAEIKSTKVARYARNPQSLFRFRRQVENVVDYFVFA
ncbi:MAG: hypothetical protein E5Y88_29015 [Mesorhizobium sp.]|uniref:hypothetical protein n=1 Tax=Mesorhizobium sp. TaxID=1871066 RepID=UPI0011FC118F|nr:hypothetical protein [Mesorhizobium sp.]TIL22199.1 MAG: hypothetical protein E5Y88_29015 [Mesorhizobium sp.]